MVHLRQNKKSRYRELIYKTKRDFETSNPNKESPKKETISPSFPSHMCRKSVSLTDTPQELDDHHPKLYLRFVQVPLWKKN